MVKAFLKTIGRRENLKSARMRYISSDESGNEAPDNGKIVVKVAEEVD